MTTKIDPTILNHYIPNEELLDYLIRRHERQHEWHTVAALRELSQRRHGTYRSDALNEEAPADDR